jgi:hypothetical protein
VTGRTGHDGNIEECRVTVNDGEFSDGGSTGLVDLETENEIDEGSLY